jgi:hypothetical protein
MFKEFHYQVRGRRHERDGISVQDRTGYLSQGGVQVLCLADGAGSASRSGVGAEAVVREGCRLLVKNFAEFMASGDGAQVKMDIAGQLKERLAALAQRLSCAERELASTMLAVAVAENRYIVVHVGDGVIGYVKNGELRVASAPDNAEFVNQTTFITSSKVAESMRLYRGQLDKVSGFVLMSDGTAASLYDFRSRSLAPACQKLVTIVGESRSRTVKNPAHRKALRKLLNTRIRAATKDDCSIGILARPLR